MADTDDKEETTGAPSWAKWVSRLVGVGALIALVVTLYSVGFGTIWNQLRIIGWWFVPIVLLEVASAFADAMVIHGFLGSGGRRPSYWSVLKAQVSGRAINLVTPMASLGEATKVTMLMRETSSSRAVAAVVRFNISYAGLNLMAVIIGAPICALVLPLPWWLEQTLWIGTGLAVAVIVAVALLLRAGLLGSLIKGVRTVRLLSDERAKKLQQRLKDVDKSLRGDRGLRSWLPGLWALVSKVMGWTIVWIVMNANGETPSVGVMATMASAGTVVNIISNVAPMGIGINEAGTAALMAALGVNAGLGVTTVLARRVITIFYAAIGLTLMATSDDVVPHKLRRKRKGGKGGKGTNAGEELGPGQLPPRGKRSKGKGGPEKAPTAVPAVEEQPEREAFRG